MDIYMKTFEARGKIKNIKDARNVAEKIGGIFKGYYRATDIIFKAKESDPEKGVIDLRIFKINNRQTKNYILTHKIAEWSDKTKTDKIIIKGKFDTMEEVLHFMIDRYGDVLKEDYKYSREIMRKLQKKFKLRYGSMRQGGVVCGAVMFGNVYYGEVRNKDR